jgi:hypothetical protein
VSAGWVKLHRKLLEHPRSSDPDWVAVWVYLLLNATHAPLRKVFNGSSVILRPGQLICGRYVIAAATGVHASKVQRVLAALKTDQQIDQQGGNKSSIITILNWALYQGVYQQNGQQMISSRSANDQQPIALQEQENGRREREQPVEFPPGFPKTVEEAKAHAAFVGCTEDFAAQVWNECAGRNGNDSFGQPVRRWREYLAGRIASARSKTAERQHRNHSRPSTSPADHSDPNAWRPTT